MRAVGVLPDVTGIDRVFSYAVPPELDAAVAIGTVVRVPLGPRHVRGWVVEDPALEAPDDASSGPSSGPSSGRSSGLRAIDRVVSLGPTTEVVELGRSAAFRYAGRLRSFLVPASSDRVVRELPRPVGAEPLAVPPVDGPVATAVRDAIAARTAVLRLPPASPRLDVCLAAIAELAPRGGSVLVLVPTHAEAERLGALLVSRAVPVAPYPDAWETVRAGAPVVLGTRNAVLAPMPHLAGIVVLDAHDESYVAERAPTWRAPALAARRAWALGCPCLLVSPTPPLEVLALGTPIALPSQLERGGWPRVEVVDRRGEDPRSGLFAEGLGEVVRAARRQDPHRPVVAVLNRTGRARLLACRTCGELAACERCHGAMVELEAHAEGGPRHVLACRRCGLERPVICAHCGSTRLRALRLGVQRVAIELGALVGEGAREVSSPSDGPLDAGLLVGTEAVLHRVRGASLVVFLDFDQELASSRLRGRERALALVARAGRLVGGRGAPEPGFRRRVVLQTRQPDHEVVRAALEGNPAHLAELERATRELLRLPPYAALARVEGPDAAAIGVALEAHGGVDVAPDAAGGLLVRAEDADALAHALHVVGASERDARVAVDPDDL